MLAPPQVTQAVTEEQKKPHEVLPVRLVRVDEYTTFVAELAILQGDIVFHFYVTDEVNAGKNPQLYWKEVFPIVLSKTAEEHFKAQYPRLKAAYTEEKASWWMRAYGFGLVLNPHKYAYSFLATLDAALDAANTR